MSKVDVSTWKSFRVGDLFDVLLPKGDMQPKLLFDGDIPLISAGTENNGVVMFVDSKGDGVSKMFDAAMITVSMFGQAFYQNKPFYAVSHGRINVLKAKHVLTDYIGMFLASVLTVALCGRYDFATMCNQSRLTEERISLPATPTGEPDWDYMEQYMKQVMEREEMFAEHLASLTAEAVADGHEIDVSEWGQFRVGDLFEKLTLKYKGDHPFQKALDLSDTMTDEFNLPLVNAKLGDNGIMYYGRQSDWESVEMTLDIVEDGAASVGTVYAQPQLTGVLYNAYLIKLKVDTTANCLLFISSVMERYIKQYFSYSNKCTWAKVKAMTVSLPVTPAGDPNWAYMEQFMQRQMDKSKMLVEHLDKIWNS